MDQSQEKRSFWRPKFTLLHLLFLVFLVGIATGVVLSLQHTDLFVPHYLKSRPSDSVSRCAANVTRIALALEAYAHDHHGQLPQSQNELVPKYLAEFPECPAAHRMTYRTMFGPHAGYNPGDDPNYFLVECTGENHGSLWVAPNFPAYDNRSGLLVEQAW